MEIKQSLKIIIGLVSTISLIILLFYIYFFFSNRKSTKDESCEEGSSTQIEKEEEEEFISFRGGENLTIKDILEAPGEVIGKSSYGTTLYKASLEKNDHLVKLVRFLRPTSCTHEKMIENSSLIIKMLGYIRHPNLVPLQAYYSGFNGEKLLVYPFFVHGNLQQFIQDGNGDSNNWDVIYKISLGIVEGLDYLHTGLQKPIIHGNLKSKNIILGENYESYLSDFSLYLLLNSKTSQEMLQASAEQGYKPSELIKMKDASKESDIYSLGVIFLELLSGKEPINENPSSKEDRYLPNSMRNAIIDYRITDIFHPNLFLRSTSSRNVSNEECLLAFFQLAIACCSPIPRVRPNIKQVLSKLREISQ